MGYANIYPLSQLEFGSPTEPPIGVGAVAADIAFASATITVPAWLSVTRISHAFVDWYVPYLKNTFAGQNYVDGSTWLQISVDGGVWHNANKIFNGSFWLLNADTMGTSLIRMVGNYDMVSYLVDACTIAFRWDNAKALGDSIVIHNSWFILRLVCE